MPAKNISVNCLILCDLCTFLLRSSCMQVCWSMVWKNQIDVLAGCRPSEFFSDQGVTDLQLAPKKNAQYHTKQFLVPSIIMSSCYCPFWHIFFFQIISAIWYCRYYFKNNVCQKGHYCQCLTSIYNLQLDRGYYWNLVN